MDSNIQGCYNCANYVRYRHSTGNVECKNGIRQFGFGDRLYCCDWKEDNKEDTK